MHMVQTRPKSRLSLASPINFRILELQPDSFEDSSTSLSVSNVFLSSSLLPPTRGASSAPFAGSNPTFACRTSPSASSSLLTKMALAEEKVQSSLGFLQDNALMSTLRDTYLTLEAKREALGLPNPGTVDNIDREVQREVLLTNQMFTGLRADIQRVFAITPLFRIQHGFAMGSQALPPYSYSALYGTPRVSHASSLIGGMPAKHFYDRSSSKRMFKMTFR